jgi:hypothetical protein
MSQLQVTGEAKIRDIQGPVVANDGVITALDGAASQYVRGDGTLADFPTSSGGGSSVSYYLNSSVSQGTIGGVAYRELSKEPIIGAGTDIAISANGYVASYLTDANDPDVLSIPGGNFNCEFYFSVNNNTGNPFFYAELYKYDGTTFTLLGSSVGVPEYINQGTIIAPYYFAIPVATATLALTDRLAIRIYVNVAGRTITLHTENGHLCQVVTTLSKGMVSLNNLTDQSQFLTTGTSGTNFNIASSGDTHTFNLPIASATNTGKLSSTDWSTFNNKQNALTNPITGTGASGQVSYFNGTNSITGENAFNYDASTNRLGVNTTVPNATIGANAGTDSGYSLLLKNDNANYNGIGFGTDSTYGNLIATEKLGTAPARNLTLLNQSGYISITEVGNLGVNILNPNAGIDIYNSTTSSLWLHTAASGVTGSDGVRLFLSSNTNAVLRNNEGSLSMSSEGDFYVITIGAENIRVNSANGFVGIGNPTTLTSLLTVNGAITQSSVLSSLLKTNASGTLVAAIAGTDYVVPSALSAYVPTSRTLTINGTTFDLSANRSWTITSDITGSGADGRVAYWNGTNSLTSEAGFIYDSSTNRLGVNTSVPNATIGADAALNSGYGLLIKTGASNYNGIGIAIDSTYGNTIETAKLGTAPARNLTLLNQGGFISITENGNLGVNILTANTGIDIYNSTTSQLWLHNAATGIGPTDGVRLALFNNKNANLRNLDGAFSITAEGDFQIITIGAENFRINSANGFVGIGDPATLPSMLTVNGGATISGLTTGQIVFPTSGGTLSGTNSLFWDNTNAKLGIGTNVLSGARVTISSTTEANHLQLVSNAPALTFINAISFTHYATVGMATANNNFITGAVLGDLVLGAYNTNNIWFYNANTNTVRMRIDSDGGGTFSSFVSASGPKSQIRVNGNSVGCGIALTNTIVGANRRNWGIFTEQDVEGDFVIKRSNFSGSEPQSGTTILSLSRTGAATFSSSVTAVQGIFRNSGVPAIQAIRELNVVAVGTAGQGIEFGALNGATPTAGAAIYGTLDNPATTGDLIFQTRTSGSLTNKMTITSGGNVGIGTSSPVTFTNYNTVSVNGTIGGAYVTMSNGTAALRMACGDLDSALWEPRSVPMLFATNNTERMRILASGSIVIKGFSTNAFASALIENSNSNLAFYSTEGAGTTKDILFQVGGSASASNMTLKANGNLLIGTTADAGYKLQVNGAMSANGIFYSFGSGAGLSAGNREGSNNYVWIGYNAGLRLYNDGNGLFLAEINPSNGIYTPLSDVNKKKDFEASKIGLNAILGLKPTLYRMKTQDETIAKELGFIAQEVKEFIPQAYVETGVEDKFIGLNYNAIVAALVKAIQEQQAQIEELKELIKNK